MKNYKKNQTYAELMEKLNLAIKNEFYYEAIFIAYAIFEDRTESLLRHAGMSAVDIKGRPLKLFCKIEKIMNAEEFTSFYCKKHRILHILNEVDKWRDKRNKLIHDLVNSPYSNDEIKDIAIYGYELVCKLNNKSTLVNKYFDEKRSRVSS